MDKHAEDEKNEYGQNGFKAEPGQRREIRVPSKTIEIEFRCQHDESSDSEYCWLNGLSVSALVAASAVSLMFTLFAFYYLP